MPRHKKGTVARARTREELGEDTWELNSSDEVLVPNGYLYAVERFLPADHPCSEYGADAYECRSLVTGAVIQLFPNEITTRMKKEHNHG